MSSNQSESMSPEQALKYIPYPLAVVGLAYKGAYWGCTVAWITQVSYQPIKFAVAVGKHRKTGEVLNSLGLGSNMSVSFLSEQDRSTAAIFGKMSCRDTPKWDLVPHTFLCGVPVLKFSALAFAGEIIDLQDMGSHTLVVIAPKDFNIPSAKEEILTYDYGTI